MTETVSFGANGTADQHFRNSTAVKVRAGEFAAPRHQPSHVGSPASVTNMIGAAPAARFGSRDQRSTILSHMAIDIAARRGQVAPVAFVRPGDKIRVDGHVGTVTAIQRRRVHKPAVGENRSDRISVHP